ncbi:GMC oxidoreductase [Actinomadura sp. K4S16]|uniref:GMC oxidoreductase n=1 Tax=Actinomadura sp. K4S16 TaxID=1316147 RepID=UPI00190F8F44|nr:GMC oxidoreductase [Actinomadura sp. K4S16]
MTRVLIVGSGPTGAAYARVLTEALPSIQVVMVDAGPILTDPPGMNIKNIPEPGGQAAARDASQGTAGLPGVAGVPGGTVAEGTVTARHGTHLIGRPAKGSGGMPAAAVSTCVGGQGAHWTCATPRPTGTERVAFIDPAEWEEHVADAERLLHTTHSAFTESPQADAALALLADAFPDVPVRRLPIAADPKPDGMLRWAGTDVVLPRPGRFLLRPRTLCTRLLVSGNRVTGAVLRDQETGASERLEADAVVVAADALRTPQLLWASGIRPPALGRYLTEHPLLFGVVAVRPGTLPAVRARSLDPITTAVNLGYSDTAHPFHAQLMFTPTCPVPLPPDHPQADNPAGYIGMGWGVRKWPRSSDRVTFDDGAPDDTGLPAIRIAYELTEREEAELDRARSVALRAAALFGDFLPGMPRAMPAGSSLHYMGTFRMGPADDGTSVCDTYSRLWGTDGLVLAGNGLIPTANACNPTLTSVALAARGAAALAARLRMGTPIRP